MMFGITLVTGSFLSGTKNNKIQEELQIMKKRKLLALMAALIVVGSFYAISQFRVNSELEETQVYFAKNDIPPHTEITADMIEHTNVPKKGLPPGIVMDMTKIVGQFTQASYGLSQNSYFFQNKIVSEQELLDYAKRQLEPGQVLWTGNVNLLEIAAGNVIEGSKVDIWFQAVEGSNATSGTKEQWVSGKMYRSIKVISTKNKKAEDLTTKNTTNTVNSQGQSVAPKKELYPTVVQLAVTEDQFRMLNSATSNAFRDSAIIMVPSADENTIPDLGEKDPYDIKPYILSKEFDINNIQKKETSIEGTNVSSTIGIEQIGDANKGVTGQ